MDCMFKRNHVLAIQERKFLDPWKNQLEVTRSNLRDVLLKEYVEKYFKLQAEFRSVFAKHIIQEDWLLKLEIIWRDWRKNCVKRS